MDNVGVFNCEVGWFETPPHWQYMIHWDWFPRHPTKHFCNTSTLHIVACHLPQGSKIWWRDDMSGGLTSARKPHVVKFREYSSVTLTLSIYYTIIRPMVGRNNIYALLPVMCESESGFKAFWAGFGFRPWKAESGFGFKKKLVDSDSNPDSNFCLPITTLLKKPSAFIMTCWVARSTIDLHTRCRIRIRIRIQSCWNRIRIQENSDGFGFVWIRIRDRWIRDSDSKCPDSHITDCWFLLLEGPILWQRTMMHGVCLSRCIKNVLLCLFLLEAELSAV